MSFLLTDLMISTLIIDMRFSHIGIPTKKVFPDSIFVESTMVHISDFQKCPYQIEWLRFENDSPIKGPVRDQMHFAYTVKSIELAALNMEELIKPWFPLPNLRAGFYLNEDGLVFEFMEHHPEYILNIESSQKL